MNKNIIAIDQDPLGIQAKRIINNDNWQVFLKPLHNDEYALGILNTASTKRSTHINFSQIGLPGKYKLYDVWNKKTYKNKTAMRLSVDSHETVVFRLSK